MRALLRSRCASRGDKFPQRLRLRAAHAGKDLRAAATPPVTQKKHSPKKMPRATSRAELPPRTSATKAPATIRTHESAAKHNQAADIRASYSYKASGSVSVPFGPPNKCRSRRRFDRSAAGATAIIRDQ